MFRTIVVGYDDTERGADALALGRQLLDPDGGRLLVAAVVPLAPGVLLTADDDHVQAACAHAQEELGRAAELLGSDVPYELVPVGDTSAARGLDRLAEERGADLIVLGSTHRHAAGIFTGRTTVQRLLHGAPCAVALAAHGQAERFAAGARIAVAYDGSPEARTALGVAFSLAAGLDATVDICRVADSIITPYGLAPAMIVGETLEADRERAQRDIDEAIAQAPAGVATEGHVLTGASAAALLEATSETDLLVSGSRSYGPLRRVLAGSVSIALLTEGSVPVLVTPRPHEQRIPASRPVPPVAAVV